MNVAMLSKWHVHAPDYANQVRNNGSKITCVWDEIEERGKAWAAELGCDFESDLATLLARSDVDAVVCDTPTAMHRDVLVPAAKAGKHIFTEKTLAPTMKEALEIAKAVEEAGVVFTISFPQRTNPVVLYAKQVIDSGVLGKVNTIRLRNAHSGASGNWLPAYWYIEKDACGGAMMDLGCHPMYISNYLLGEPARITSMYNTITGKTVEDNAVNLIEFKNQAIAIVETSFVTPSSPWMFEVYGTEGNLFGTDGKVRITSTDTKKYTDGYIDVTRLPSALRPPIKSWIDAIENGGKVDFGMSDALGLVKLLEGAYIAHKNNTVHIY
ncbi:MAG: Gfo/Idh/MocA family protein [Eubacteriales bacterium]